MRDGTASKSTSGREHAHDVPCVTRVLPYARAPASVPSYLQCASAGPRARARRSRPTRAASGRGAGAARGRTTDAV